MKKRFNPRLPFPGASNNNKPPMFFNCAASIPLKLDFDVTDVGHTVVFGTSRKGMSIMAEGITKFRPE